MISALLFILIFGILVITHEGGHFLAARKCGVHVKEFWLGIGPSLWTKNDEKNGTIFKIKAVPLGGACVFDDSEQVAKKPIPKEHGEVFFNAALWKRMIIILAGPGLNFSTAVVFALVIVLLAGIDKPIIETVIEGSPAQKAGIEVGDIILERNGEPISIFRDFTFAGNMGTVEDTAKPVTMKLKKPNGEIYEVTITPEFDESRGKNMIGITGGMNSSAENIGEVIFYSNAEIGYWVNYMKTFFEKMASHDIGIESLSGPIGIANFIGSNVKIAAQNGAKQVLITISRLIVFLSINLGIINLVPFPGLDGGQFLLLVIEKLRRGKRISEEHVNQFNMFGIAVLLIISGYIFIQDAVLILASVM